MSQSNTASLTTAGAMVGGPIGAGIGFAIGFAMDSTMGSSEKKHKEAMEKYRNGMRRLQDGVQQDSITYNEIYATIDQRNKQIANEINFAGASSSVAVNSALSGFNGRTSEALSREVQRSKLLSTQALDNAYERERTSFDMQRLNSALGTQVTLEDGWVEPVDYLGFAMSGVSGAVKGGAFDGGDDKGDE